MRRNILKSLLVTLGTLIGTVLLGLIGVSRRADVILPTWLIPDRGAGWGIAAAGLVLSLVTAVLILRYFIFVPRAEQGEGEGGDAPSVRPIAVTSVTALWSMVGVGLGMGMVFDPVAVYVIYLGASSVLCLTVAAVIFLFSVIRHKIRRRFAWIVAGIFTLLAVLLAAAAIPSVQDLGVSRSELTAVTGTVSGTSHSMGMLSGPGRTQVVIKGTSGETMTLRCGEGTGTLRKGGRYTFYYLPHTKYIDKVAEAEPIQY